MEQYDFAASGRVDAYHCELVDPFTLTPVGEVGFDPAATSINYDYEGDNKIGATVKLAEGSDYRAGGKAYAVRITDVVSFPDGAQFADVLGTFLVDNCASNSMFTHVARDLTCYSTLWRHSSDSLMNDFARPQHYVIAQAIKELVEADGGTLVFAPDASVDQQMQTNVWFELGREKLGVINEMARWTTGEVVPDVDGTLVLRHKWRPEQLEPVYTFEAGRNCVYKAGIAWDSSRSKILNRVIAYYSGNETTGDDVTMRAVAELPYWSEWSFENIGFHRTEVVRVNDKPSSQDALQSTANNHLAQNSGEIIHIEIEHVGIPGLQVGDVVRYINEHDHPTPLNLVCQVMQMNVPSLTPGRMTQTKLKVVRWD